VVFLGLIYRHLIINHLRAFNMKVWKY